MDESSTKLSIPLLKQCADASPQPWYLKDYAETSGVDRETLYGPLNDLRVRGCITLTEWVAGKGQGYSVTPFGREVLANPAIVESVQIPNAVAEPERATTTFERGEEARRAYYFGGRPVVTPVLIAINIIVFVVLMIVSYRESGSVSTYLGRGEWKVFQKYGGVSAADLAAGEWWRLVTCCFLHGGLMHLVLNMFSLYLARRAENLWGSGRFLVLYLICGVCGSCAAVFLNPGTPEAVVVLVGASGAIWGVMGSIAGWLYINRSHLPPQEVRPWAMQLVYVFLLNIGLSMLPDISLYAHAGGGIIGVICAFALTLHRFGPPQKRSFAGIFLALVPTAALLALSVGFESSPKLRVFQERAKKIKDEGKTGRLMQPGRDADRAVVRVAFEDTRPVAAEQPEFDTERHRDDDFGNLGSAVIRGVGRSLSNSPANTSS